MNQCLHCRKRLSGRSDKKFCSINCKNQFSYKNRSRTKTEVQEVDLILHRNHLILTTLMGDQEKIQIDRMVLARAKFNFQFFTSIYRNKENKIYYLVYNIAWMEFSNQTILIVRRRKK